VIEQNDLIFAYFHPLGHAPAWEVPPFFEAAGWSKSTFDARDYRTAPDVVMRDLADQQHFKTVHGFESVQITMPFHFNGPHGRMQMSFKRRLALAPLLKTSGFISSSTYGPGVQESVVRTLAGVMFTRHLVMPTPMDGTTTRVTLASSVRLEFGPRLLSQAVLRLAGRILLSLVQHELIQDIHKDARSWETAGLDYLERSIHDPHFASFREWRAQFYTVTSA